MTVRGFSHSLLIVTGIACFLLRDGVVIAEVRIGGNHARQVLVVNNRRRCRALVAALEAAERFVGALHHRRRTAFEPMVDDMLLSMDGCVVPTNQQTLRSIRCVMRKGAAALTDGRSLAGGGRQRIQVDHCQ